MATPGPRKRKRAQQSVTEENRSALFLQDTKKRKSSFYKRNGGLLKSARELSTLTGCECFVLTCSENGKVHTFSTEHFRPIIRSEVGLQMLTKCLSENGEEVVLELDDTDVTPPVKSRPRAPRRRQTFLPPMPSAHLPAVPLYVQPPNGSSPHPRAAQRQRRNQQQQDQQQRQPQEVQQGETQQVQHAPQQQHVQQEQLDKGRDTDEQACQIPQHYPNPDVSGGGYYSYYSPFPQPSTGYYPPPAPAPSDTSPSPYGGQDVGSANNGQNYSMNLHTMPLVPVPAHLLPLPPPHYSSSDAEAPKVASSPSTSASTHAHHQQDGPNAQQPPHYPPSHTGPRYNPDEQGPMGFSPHGGFPGYYLVPYTSPANHPYPEPPMMAPVPVQPPNSRYQKRENAKSTHGVRDGDSQEGVVNVGGGSIAASTGSGVMTSSASSVDEPTAKSTQ